MYSVGKEFTHHVKFIFIDCLQWCNFGSSMIHMYDIQECPFWSFWTLWGECSAPCNGGVQSRSRLCINGEPGDEGCLGTPEEEEYCNPEVIRRLFWMNYKQLVLVERFKRRIYYKS